MGKKGYNVQVCVKWKHGQDYHKEFKGRLVGFINSEERRALMNAEGAASKVYTSESIEPDDTGIVKYNRFFVVATREYPDKENEEVIYISPKITSINHATDKTFECSNNKMYVLKKIN
jgi:hypothetical protein